MYICWAIRSFSSNIYDGLCSVSTILCETTIKRYHCRVFVRHCPEPKNYGIKHQRLHHTKCTALLGSVLFFSFLSGGGQRNSSTSSQPTTINIQVCVLPFFNLPPSVSSHESENEKSALHDMFKIN